MFGLHSIGYRELESYFYLFGVRRCGRWLSWEEVEETALLFDFPTVPVLAKGVRLEQGPNDSMGEDKVLAEWLYQLLGMEWEDYVQTPGSLGGYNPETGEDTCEGLVIRSSAGFETKNGLLAVAENEFDSLFKLVRRGHVKTDEHWTKNWKPARLTDYAKHDWHAYQYLGAP